jgi:hypothetical protein
MRCREEKHVLHVTKNQTQVFLSSSPLISFFINTKAVYSSAPDFRNVHEGMLNIDHNSEIHTAGILVFLTVGIQNM